MVREAEAARRGGPAPPRGDRRPQRARRAGVPRPSSCSASWATGCPIHEKARAEQLVADARQAIEEQAGLDRVRPLARRPPAGRPGLPAAARGRRRAHRRRGRRRRRRHRRRSTRTRRSSMPSSRASGRTAARPPRQPRGAERPAERASSRRASRDWRTATSGPSPTSTTSASARPGGRAAAWREHRRLLRGLARCGRQRRAGAAHGPAGRPAGGGPARRARPDAGDPARQGVERIGAVGEPFDPERHEAMAVVATRGVPHRTRRRGARPGYALAGGCCARPRCWWRAAPRGRTEQSRTATPTTCWACRGTPARRTSGAPTAASPGAPPRRQQGARRGEPLQGDLRGLRGAGRPREARALRPLRAELAGRAGGRRGAAGPRRAAARGAAVEDVRRRLGDGDIRVRGLRGPLRRASSAAAAPGGGGRGRLRRLLDGRRRPGGDARALAGGGRRGRRRRITIGDGRSYEVEIPRRRPRRPADPPGGRGRRGRGRRPRGRPLPARAAEAPPALPGGGARPARDLPVAPCDAALGASVEVPTLDGTARVQGAARARPADGGCACAARACPTRRGPRRPLRTVRIVVPKELSDEEREAFERLRSATGTGPRSRAA